MITKNSALGYCLPLMVLAFGGPSFARPSTVPGPIPAHVTKIIDGDTVAIEAYIWPGQWVAVHVRIRGIDTPEIHSHCDGEHRLALAAKEFVATKLSQGQATLTNINIDKYGGRVVANVTTPDGENLASLLLEKGLARAYDGGHKTPWCPGLSNRD